MPRRLGDDGETRNRRRIRHRNGRRTRKKGPEQVRIAGLTNVDLRDHDTPDRDENAPNTQDHGCGGHANGSGDWKVTLGKVQRENERYIDPEVLEDDNLVYWFMTKDGHDRGRFHQAELVDSFCRQTAFQELRSNDSELSSREVCLINDRTNDGKVSAPLGDYKALSVYGMYLRLMEKRFHLQSSAGTPTKPSANRRLIFVTDPDSHGMATLMVTAPLSQVEVLSDFLYYYVAFKPYIGDFSQLGDRKQSVDKYIDGDVPLDPFTDCDADTPILDPGEYFLTCLDCHSKLIKNQWVKTAWEFKQKVEAHMRNFKFGSTKSSPLTYQESQKPLEWLCQTRLLLIDLITTLDTTINCWDTFASKDRFSTPYGRRCLTSIDQTFGEAKNCLKELKNIRTLCDEHENMFKLHTIDVGNHAAHVQAQAAEKNQQLSFIQLYAVAPVILTAAILSMQEKAIPGFLGPNKLSFIVLVPIMIILVFALSKIMDRWEKIRLFVFYFLAPRQVHEEHGIELV